MLKPSGTIAGQFSVSDPGNAGALSNTDSLPVGSLIEDEVADGAVTVTVTNISTGVYSYSATIPADYTLGTNVSVLITSVLNSKSIAGVVRADTVDLYGNGDLAGAAYIATSHALDQTKLAADLVDDIYDEALSGHTTADTGGASLQSRYWFQMDFNGDVTSNAYECTRWYKDQTPLDSGVTVPTIQVIIGSSGADLIAETAMTEAGSSHLFRYVSGGSQLTIPDVSYVVRCTATIDGATRTWEKNIRGSQ
jgi:hypothetical protein